MRGGVQLGSNSQLVLLELGLDHFAVSVQLGHEDGGALVMALYGHPSKDTARERLLGAFGADPDRRPSSTDVGSPQADARTAK
jgi:hypothetical protein